MMHAIITEVKMKIGIFDSGIGGISVLHEAIKRMPEAEFMFYADTDHVPYGLRTKEEILEFSREIVRFLIDKDVEAIVIACNTATAVAAEKLRQEFDIPIIGMEPAVKPAVKINHDDKRILVMATPVTIRENKLHKLLSEVDKEHLVDLLEMPGLVKFAESGLFEDDEVRDYLRDRYEGLKLDDYSALVLGCTHFNYFIPLYREFFPEDTAIIDGNEGTVRQLMKVVGKTENADAIKSDAEEQGKAVSEKADEPVQTYAKVTYFLSGREPDEKTLEFIGKLHRRLDEIA